MTAVDGTGTEGAKEKGASSNGAYAGGTAHIDGRLVPLAEARIPILDWGFLRSDATYDVVHVWKGAFFRLEDHLDRFERNMAALRLDPGLTRPRIRDILMECVARSGLRDAYVEMICTRGQPPVGSRDPRKCQNRFYAFTAPFVFVADENQRARGLHMRVSERPRIPPESVNPTVKNYHWMDLTAGLFEALDKGAESVVLTDGRGHVTEGPGFNVFIVTDGRVATPDVGVLDGITRRTVIELCGLEGIPCQARAVAVTELKAADEVFITSTAGGAMPVTRIDGAPVGEGTPGPITQRLSSLYWSKQESGWLATKVEYGDG